MKIIINRLKSFGFVLNVMANVTERAEHLPWVWCVSFKVLSTVGKPAYLNSETKAHAL